MITDSISIRDIGTTPVKGNKEHVLQLLIFYCVGVYQNEKRNVVQLHLTIHQIGPIDENENGDDHPHRTKMLLLKMMKVILQL